MAACHDDGQEPLDEEGLYDGEQESDEEALYGVEQESPGEKHSRSESE